jgi:benzoate/toluate 1,2-dioxygenase reductase component
MGKTSVESFEVFVSRLLWLTETVFEVGFRRPEGFTFVPGQKIRLAKIDTSREYTLVNHPDALELTICVRHVASGCFSPLLARARIGDSYAMSSAAGFFTYQSKTWPAVFIATGTGIAPFLAFVRAGVRDFYLLQGARTERDLLYREEMSGAAGEYIPCLSASENQGLLRSGHVTNYLEKYLPSSNYDFYLCGNSNMMRDAIRIIDRSFPDSRVYMETFF